MYIHMHIWAMIAKRGAENNYYYGAIVECGNRGGYCAKRWPQYFLVGRIACIDQDQSMSETTPRLARVRVAKIHR